MGLLGQLFPGIYIPALTVVEVGDVDVHGYGARVFGARGVGHLEDAAILLIDLHRVRVVDVGKGEADGFFLGAQLADVGEAGRGAHQRDCCGAAVVRVLRVGDVALRSDVGRDGVLVVGEGNHAVRGKAGDDTAAEADGHFHGVVGGDFFGHCLFLLSSVTR
mgnify:CR=1 FL=1